ncbi:hypothetical protein NDU88_004807 [Pleurodeles waltl]|uniref:Uncharacterized protein n=1 Tax=Pleurodeles waltl TaxID=8319 RepID=A0AAV7SJU7_PLEWA|nr:hypothetical protein NDU88_004807 [Pleurodeles waltl]
MLSLIGRTSVGGSSVGSVRPAEHQLMAGRLASFGGSNVFHYYGNETVNMIHLVDCKSRHYSSCISHALDENNFPFMRCVTPEVKSGDEVFPIVSVAHRGHVAELAGKGLENPGAREDAPWPGKESCCQHLWQGGYSHRSRAHVPPQQGFVIPPESSGTQEV